MPSKKKLKVFTLSHTRIIFNSSELEERFAFPNPALQGGANDIQPFSGLVLKFQLSEKLMS